MGRKKKFDVDGCLEVEGGGAPMKPPKGDKGERGGEASWELKGRTKGKGTFPSFERRRCHEREWKEGKRRKEKKKRVIIKERNGNVWLKNLSVNHIKLI